MVGVREVLSRKLEISIRWKVGDFLERQDGHGDGDGDGGGGIMLKYEMDHNQLASSWYVLLILLCFATCLWKCWPDLRCIGEVVPHHCATRAQCIGKNSSLSSNVSFS